MHTTHFLLSTVLCSLSMALDPRSASGLSDALPCFTAASVACLLCKEEGCTPTFILCPLGPKGRGWIMWIPGVEGRDFSQVLEETELPAFVLALPFA